MSSSSLIAGPPMLFCTEFTHLHVFLVEFVEGANVNEGLTTTGVSPVTVGSTLTLELVPTKNWLPWSLVLATVNLLMTEPSGASHSIAAVVDAAGVLAAALWTVPDLPGAWRLAWEVTDADGVHLISLPYFVDVIESPGVAA